MSAMTNIKKIKQMWIVDWIKVVEIALPKSSKDPLTLGAWIRLL